VIENWALRDYDCDQKWLVSAHGITFGSAGLTEARRKDTENLRRRRFHRLRVLAVLPRRLDLPSIRDTSWLCRCICGNLTIARASRLKCGMKKSCGCYRRETSSAKARVYLDKIGPAQVRILPPMTREESLLYRKIKWGTGVSRADALAVMGKARTS
jgi:hypothetical protein